MEKNSKHTKRTLNNTKNYIITYFLKKMEPRKLETAAFLWANLMESKPVTILLLYDWHICIVYNILCLNISSIYINMNKAITSP